MKIFDTHVHTNYAYCAEGDMHPKSTIDIADKSDYGICLIEHAGQLYVGQDDYWSGNFLQNPGMIYDEKSNRMEAYIEFIKKFRGENVKIGIETEVDKFGELTLRAEHKAGWDILLGAVHRLPNRFEHDKEAGFLWSVEMLCKNSDVLAHPFRFFFRSGLNTPKRLYAPTVKLLKDSGVSAELNFHTNEPDMRFFAMCVENGVKISLGSDAHSLFEVCDLQPHFDMLKTICGNADLIDVLFSV